MSIDYVPKTGAAATDNASPRLLHVWAGIICIALTLSGCGLSGGAMKKAESDQALLTGAVPPETPVDQDRMSDEATIRNAVSSANLDVIGPQPLSWANQDTGSRGAVSSIAEASQDGRVCRKFETSRESFEGIALFTGKTCLNDDGQWTMLNFDAL